LSVLSIKDDDILFSLIDSIYLISVLGIVAVFPDSMSLYPAFVRYCPQFNGNHHHILDFVNQYLVNILSILDHNDKFKDINSKIREYCGQYLTNAGYKDMESGKTATMPDN
jgi:hypothetical protein